MLKYLRSDVRKDKIKMKIKTMVKENIRGLLLLSLLITSGVCLGNTVKKDIRTENANIACLVDCNNGNLKGLYSVKDEEKREWLSAPWRIVLSNTKSKETAVLKGRPSSQNADIIDYEFNDPDQEYRATGKWYKTGEGVGYTLTLSAEGSRKEHSCRISIPVNGKSCYGFAASQSGVVDLKKKPLSALYGGRDDAIMPLMSLLDVSSDQALTIAVAADCFLPEINMKLNEDSLVFEISNFGLGESKPVEIKLIFYGHAADYRAALKAYSTDFPRWFKSPVPRNPQHEGAFWYHHIMETPDKEELSRQDVRAIWSSFFFEVIGQFVPMRDEGDEWFPYTYRATWSRQKYAGTEPIKEKMTYDRINAFTDTLKEMGIGHYAYFNFNEYGGKSPNQERLDKRLKNIFANSKRYKANGKPGRSWEGSTVMNPDPSRPFGKHLIDQAKLHLENIPSLSGFCVDQVHHESSYDYSPFKTDGLTMVNGKPVYHVGKSVMDITEQLCEVAHEKGKQVYINNSFKLCSMKDVDGYMYEFPPLRTLSYCAPYRYVAGWHHRKDYYNTEDLLQFEANLKRRLKYAVFPHMIPKDFKICQQRPDREAAAMLEIYAPLFKQLAGKEQVLEPHCIAVSGANEVNLFRNQDGQYVIPVISRVHFLSRRVDASERIKVKLTVGGTDKITWACVYSDDKAPYFATVEHSSEGLIVNIDKHYSASVIVAGTENKPQSIEWSDHVKSHLASNFPYINISKHNNADQLRIGEIASAEIRILGQYVDDARFGRISVWVNKKELGYLKDSNTPGFQGLIQRTEKEQRFSLPKGYFTQMSGVDPVIKLNQVEEESWYAPRKVELWLTPLNGNAFKAAVWNPQSGTLDTGLSENVIAPSIELPLHWIKK